MAPSLFWGNDMRLVAFLALMLLVAPAQAEVQLTGTFTATQSCPALQSIRRGTNPGDVTTQPGTSYQLLAANSDNPSHFWIVVSGASPDRRWVAVDCGMRNGAAAGTFTAPQEPRTRGQQYVLAVNWQPAFCETSPRKPECRDQSADSFEATNFTLHGLWPQPRSNEFCGVSEDDRWASENGDWQALPALRLSAGLRRELNQVMPGTRSALERHEWTKHGTCYGTSQEEYYRDATDLLLGLNASPVAELFADNIGKKITLRQVRTAFDAAYGPGAGERVAMDCTEDGNRTIITELTLNLAGTINGPDDLAGLIAAARPVEGGCASGMVDPVGIR